MSVNYAPVVQGLGNIRDILQTQVEHSFQGIIGFVFLLKAVVILLGDYLGTLTTTVNTTHTDLAVVKDQLTNWRSQVDKDLDEIKQRMGTVESATANRYNQRVKLASEHRAISDLEVLASDRSEFRHWNELLVNALSQVQPATRDFTKAVKKVLDRTRTAVTDDQIKEMATDHNIDIGKLEEDMYYVLTAKCKGEAGLRVASVEPGEGIKAYQKVYLWFSGVSGMALTARSRMVMQPEVPKKDEDLADAVEEWVKQLRVLRGYGPQYDLNVSFKVTALETIMENKKDKFEEFEEDAKKISEDEEERFEYLLKRVLEYATKRRKEAEFKRTKGDPMDIGEVTGQQGMRSKEQEGGFWVCDMESGWYWNDEEPSISQLGKGKAMGKGMYGKGMYQPGKGGKGEGKAAAWDGGKGYGKMGSKGGTCWTCGEHGHQARNCPKAAGKGGGGGAGGAPTGIFEGYCYICGGYGHSSKWCPKGKGKGKGKINYTGYEEAAGVVELGGGIEQVTREEEWQVPARRSRSKRDMRPSRSGAGIHNLTRDTQKTISSVEVKGDWEVIPVTVDSAAADWVCPPEVAKHFPIRETKASKSGMKYRAANGTSIANHGERAVKGISGDWNPMGVTIQVAGVKKTLGAVMPTMKAGNRIVFDDEGSYIYNKPTGRYTTIHERGGEFVFDLWVPKAKEKMSTGMYDVLKEEEEEEQQQEEEGAAGKSVSHTGFVWQDDHL